MPYGGLEEKGGLLSASRRRLLEGALAATLLAGGAVAVGLRTREYSAPAGRKLAVLAAWQWVVVHQAAARIAAPDEFGSASLPTAHDLDVAGFVDGWLGRANARVVRDFGRFIAYLEHLAPLACGLLPRFTKLTPAEQDRVLASLEASRIDVLRAGFEGLKALVFMGYYRDPRTWNTLGYDGPFVGRPLGGWR
jgi:Gluconate 2-dehydrogenase subunit 3